MSNGEVFDGLEVLVNEVFANHRILVVDRSGANVSQRQSSKVVEVLQQFNLEQFEQEYGFTFENPYVESVRSPKARLLSLPKEAQKT